MTVKRCLCILYVALLASCSYPECGSETVADCIQDDAAEKIARAKLLFAGDVMCHMPQVYAARTDGGYDFRPVFEFVKPYFERADAAIVNLETVVSPNGRYSGYPSFASPAEFAAALKWAGVDIAVMANNHCCDRGRRGIMATTHCLDTLGISRTGVFRDDADRLSRNPLRFDCGGIAFALLNYTYGTNGLDVPNGCYVNLTDTAVMRQDLRRAADADCIVVCMHWGDEYVRKANRQQRRLADFLHRNGADIVIGSHPHVIQPADAACGRITVWSLGNFVSNQRKRFCDGGLMAEVDVEKRNANDVRCRLTLIPVWVSLPNYRIITPDADNELPGAETADYELFMRDTEKLLSSGADTQ